MPSTGEEGCVQSDKFKFKITFYDRPPTRRGIHSTVSSVYDPFGIQAPVVLSAKNYVGRSLDGMTLYQHQLIRSGGVGCKSSIFFKTSRWIVV